MDWEDQEITRNVMIMNFISTKITQSKDLIIASTLILYRFIVHMIVQYINIMNYLIDYPVPHLDTN